MQDQQNARPRVERLKIFYRTVFDAPQIIHRTGASTAPDNPPDTMPELLGVGEGVQLVYDPTIPACLINGLERYVDELQDNQLDDAVLRDAENVLNGAQAAVSRKWIETEADAGQVFWGNVASPIEVVCQSLGFQVSYRKAPTEQNIIPDHAWAAGPDPTGEWQPLTIFEHKSPAVADRHFPQIVDSARSNETLDLSAQDSSSKSILAKVRTP